MVHLFINRVHLFNIDPISNKLSVYRIEQLEKKVDKHNSVVERTFKLEGRMEEAEHDIRDLKNVVYKMESG